MKKIETVQDYKCFLNNNRDKLLKQAIKIEELPTDDEWFKMKNGMKYTNKRQFIMGKYNIGEVWWIQFPFQDKEIV